MFLLKKPFDAIMSYMHNKLLSKKLFIKRIIIYVVMILSIIIIASYVILFTLGYRFNLNDRQIEQYAMIQFNSTPAGANVFVDGKPLNIRTPGDTTVSNGEHIITMSLDGYQTWTKTVNVKSGILSWLNYAMLIPEELTTESVANYSEIYKTTASISGRYIIVQSKLDKPAFDLIDTNSNIVKKTTITIPKTLYSEPDTTGTAHSFYIDKWEDGERYVIVKHVYGEKYEWLVVDLQQPQQTKNITKLLDIEISNIEFSGVDVNVFYVLNKGDIRKIDISAGTISRPLINGVSRFDIYKSGMLYYIGLDATTKKALVGFYRDGDDKPYIIKNLEATDVSKLQCALAMYYNEYYFTISNDKDVEILYFSFSLPTNEINIKDFVKFKVNHSINNISFNPSGQYVLLKDGPDYSSYDLEYRTLNYSSVSGNGDTFSLRWLNSSYLLSDRDGSLIIREFDGANSHTINNVVTGNSISLSTNGRYIYSLNKSKDSGYDLQRVSVVLP